MSPETTKAVDAAIARFDDGLLRIEELTPSEALAVISDATSLVKTIPSGDFDDREKLVMLLAKAAVFKVAAEALVR